VSVISSYATRIRVNPRGRHTAGPVDPTWQILRDAVEVTAREFGGWVTDEITDYYGTRVPCDLAVVAPDFPRGVGVKVSPVTGEVKFIFDAHGDLKKVSQRICGSIQQNYTAIAVARTLESLHYQVEYEEEEAASPETRRVTVRGTL